MKRKCQATVLNDSNNNTNANSSQEGCDNPTKIYVGGFPYYSTEDNDIQSYFERCGTITEVDCMCFSESGKFRGIAIISFKVSTSHLSTLHFIVFQVQYIMQSQVE
ncbi:hypothetical protein AHAS_Ahas20G0108100 [Arachis hypogaea]